MDTQFGNWALEMGNALAAHWAEFALQRDRFWPLPQRVGSELVWRGVPYETVDHARVLLRSRLTVVGVRQVLR